MISKKIFAWGIYDLANTIYSALFVTLFFPLYVKNYLGGNEFMIGGTFSLSMLFVAFAVPYIGALSDIMKKRMPCIILFTVLNCIAVVLVPHAGLAWALGFALIANFFYHAALNLYNALLPDVSKGQGIGQVSGIGVAMGYVGTLIALAIGYVIVNYLGLGPREGVVAVFYATSILFFGFSLFTFIWVKERLPSIALTGKNQTNIRYVEVYVDVMERVALGIKDIFQRPALRSFLLANFFFTNSMNAVIIFLFLFSQQALGMNVNSFFPAYALFAIGAAAGSLLFARSIDTKGPAYIMKLAGWIWISVIASLLAVQSYMASTPFQYPLFLLAGTIGGAGLGLVWSANRPLLISLVPKNKLAQYFGFLGFTDKFSGVIGPVVFGFLATFYGYAWALGSLLIFFGCGLYFLEHVEKTTY